MNQPHIDLLVTIDRRYVRPLCTMLRSYIQSNPETTTDLYIAHSQLQPEDFRQIEAAAGDIRIHDFCIREHWFSDTPVLERLPEESFYRLMAFHFLPKELDRCLYLDPDILVRKSLQPLYDMPMEGYYLAAAGHMYGFRNQLNKTRLGLKKQKRYVNSGILLMNLTEIRKDFSLDSILECLERNVQKLIMGDQDLINILFGQRTVFLPEEVYNLDERTYRHFRRFRKWTLEQVAEQTAIIHYNGQYKPWLDGYVGELNVFYPETADAGPAPSHVLRKHLRSFCRITRPTARQTAVFAGLMLVALVCLGSYLCFGEELLKIIAEPELFRQWLDHFGVLDGLVFILIRAAQTVVKFIPAEPLEIASGYVWGPVLAAAFCLIGNFLGTLVIMALMQRYGQKLLRFLLSEKNRKLIASLEGRSRIYWLLFVLYLVPGSPKDGLTYLAGLLPVKPVPFLLVTFLARIPSVLSSTLCGSSLAEQEYVLAAVIFAATCILTVAGAALYNIYLQKQKAADMHPDIRTTPRILP